VWTSRLRSGNFVWRHVLHMYPSTSCRLAFAQVVAAGTKRNFAPQWAQLVCLARTDSVVSVVNRSAGMGCFDGSSPSGLLAVVGPTNNQRQPTQHIEAAHSSRPRALNNFLFPFFPGFLFVCLFGLWTGPIPGPMPRAAPCDPMRPRAAPCTEVSRWGPCLPLPAPPPTASAPIALIAYCGKQISLRTASASPPPPFSFGPQGNRPGHVAALSSLAIGGRRRSDGTDLRPHQPQWRPCDSLHTS
jgi:hypothetical protein